MSMRIDIWSDYVCPFCTVGERHLSLALENFRSRDDVEIVWRSFQLDPAAEKDPQGTMVDSLVKGKGMPREQVENMVSGLAERAAAVGLDFNWRDGVNANTWDAHRVGQLAREKGVGTSWDDTVKAGFFSQGRNVADHDTLREFADQVGLERTEVDRVLSSDEFSDQVNADIATARQIGVQGVPFFVFDGRLAVSGAQPVEVFTQALEQAVAAQ
ncbi:DsbA family oxidoreductase [Corynebacterium sp. A21]|uniref:DsbA family oxidoreductase n=1 Tax=Corynebacterium sp. A21 TaxID=3457318 RepID=UPI003FD0138D